MIYDLACIWAHLLCTVFLPFLLCSLLRGKIPRAASSPKSKQGLCSFFLDFNLMTLLCFLPLAFF